MTKSLYHSKAVMGGGKSYSAIFHLCHVTGSNIVYAVPTKKLVYEITGKIKNTENSMYLPPCADDADNTFDEPYGFDCFEGEALDESGNRFLTQRVVKVITGDSSESVVDDFIKELYTPGCDVIVVTHESLFRLEQRNAISALENWVVFIDEDPQLLKVYSVPDVGHQQETLNDIIPLLPDSSNGVTEFSVTKEVSAVISRVSDIPYGASFKEEVGDYFELISSNSNARFFFKDSDNKSIWFANERVLLANIVASALKTHILSSRLSILTQISLSLEGLTVKESKVKAEFDTFPDSIQSKVNIHRIWGDGDHSLARMKSYGYIKLKDNIMKFLDGKKFISRTNDKRKDFFDGATGHVARLSKMTMGLNCYDKENVIVDIAAYNRGFDVDEFYKMMDLELSLKEDGFKMAVIESDNLEPSAQAVCRIGLRRIRLDASKHPEYTIVIPDKKTEDYLKENYFPRAKYHGAIVKDEVRKKAGRKSGGINPETRSKVIQAYESMESGESKNKACSEAGIGKATFDKHIKRVMASMKV